MLAVYLAGGAVSFAALVACDRVTGWRAPEEPPAALRLIAVLAVLWPLVALNLALCAMWDAANSVMNSVTGKG